MKKKKISKVIIASVATVAGVFGGMKLYSLHKRKDKELRQLSEYEYTEDKIEV